MEKQKGEAVSIQLISLETVLCLHHHETSLGLSKTSSVWLVNSNPILSAILTSGRVSSSPSNLGIEPFSQKSLGNGIDLRILIVISAG